ncbi:MAG: preprotein translocase subunit SecE [Bdellovibrionota bacterium]|nr:MAG: preprotein translocase subunit SecE [Bdellovibrionota bacterium]
MSSSTSSSIPSASSAPQGNFLRDSIDELKKVSTPTRAETMQATVVTMIIIVFLSICLALIDAVFNWLMGRVIG